MATSDGTAISGSLRGSRDDERWRDLPDGYAVLSAAEVRGVYALLSSRGAAETCRRLATTAEGVEACCHGGALVPVVAGVRERLAAAATWLP
jgi:hypothetical protein